MEIKIGVSDNDVMSRDTVMEKIASAQDWTITQRPDTDVDESYRIKTKDGREGSYAIANDEIEWDDGETGSLFSDYGKDYRGESFLEFLDATTAIWGTTGDTAVDEELVLYVEN